MTKNRDLTEEEVERICQHLARRPSPPPAPARRGRQKPSPPRLTAEVKSSAKPSPERVAKGRFVTETIYAHMTDGEGAPSRVRVAEGERRRDISANIAVVLRPILCRPDDDEERTAAVSRLIRAAEMFEQSHAEAAGDARVTANLLGVGGGGRNDRMEKNIDAREAFHAALKELRDGGDEVVAVVESIVLKRSAVRAAGVQRYVRGRDQAVHVATTLEIGLRLLAAHYRIKGRIATVRPVRERAA